MHGTADLIAKPDATVKLVELAGSCDKTLELVPDDFHALLRDLNREATLADRSSPAIEKRDGAGR